MHVMLAVCTCHDYSILNNICKHIHAVVISSKPHGGPLFVSAAENASYQSSVLFNESKMPVNLTFTDKDIILSKLKALYTKIEAKEYIDESVSSKIKDVKYNG